MSEYFPHKWVVVRIISKKDNVCKVLAGWHGGYVESDWWKISAGIVGIKETKTHYEFTNCSGSVYYCPKDADGFTTLSHSIYSQVEKQLQEIGATIEIIEDLTNHDAIVLKD